jgi:hypothetical protein
MNNAMTNCRMTYGNEGLEMKSVSECGVASSGFDLYESVIMVWWYVHLLLLSLLFYL